MGREDARWWRARNRTATVASRSPEQRSRAYCGGGFGCGCASLSFSLSLPPPKIFWRKFFFLGAAGCWVVSGAFPSGGVLGAVRTMGALVVLGGVVVSGGADLLPPMPKIFWMKFCGILAHLAAGVDGRSAVEEGDVDAVVGAGGVGEEVGGLVDASGGDALGRREGFDVGVLGKLDGALHELGPDGSGGMSAFDLDVGVVVVADPDDADEVRGVAGEPGVVAGAGLAGGRGGEAMAANGSGAVP